MAGANGSLLYLIMLDLPNLIVGFGCCLLVFFFFLSFSFFFFLKAYIHFVLTPLVVKVLGIPVGGQWGSLWTLTQKTHFPKEFFDQTW